MGILYLVSTPIGNLEDITLRAIRILNKVDLLACEDTRKTGLLLQKIKDTSDGGRLTPSEVEGEAMTPPRWKEKPKLISYYEENELGRIPQIISLLKSDKNVALVSNAGTPTISDPGYKLVRECIKQGIKVEAIPGPSAILAALVSSGLPTDRFLFLGYLPKKPTKRAKIWNLVNTTLQCAVVVTIIIFEAPHRVLKTLQEIKENFGDIDIVICRELTKVYEEIRREKISESIAHFEKTKPKGEFTLLFHPPTPGVV